MRIHHKILLLFSLFLFCLFLLSACHTSSVSKSMKAIDDRKEEKAREVRTQYDKDVKKHMAMQSKETRKRMKKEEKEAKKWMKKRDLKAKECPAVK